MATTRPPLWILIKAHLAADPRKTGVLAILLVVMVGLYARLFLPGTAPRTVSAADAPSVLISEQPAVAAQGPAVAAAVVRSPRSVLATQPARHLIRDPFIAAGLHDEEAAPSRPSPPKTFSVEREERVLNEAGKLTLQSTILGSRPMATINGRVVGPGDHIEGFVLQEVASTWVTLHKEGVTVRLTLR